MNKLIIFYFLQIIFLFGLSAQRNSKSDYLRNIYLNLRSFHIDSTEVNLNLWSKENKDNNILEVINWKYVFFRNGLKPKLELSEFDSSSSDFRTGVLNLYYGDYLKETNLDEAKAYENYVNCLKIGLELKDSLLISGALRRMVIHVNDNEQNLELLDSLCLKYTRFSNDSFERDYSNLLYYRARSKIDKLPCIEEFLQGSKSAKKNNNTTILAYYFKLIGAKYGRYDAYLKENNISINNLSKSITYSQKALELNDGYLPKHISPDKNKGTYLNIGIAYSKKKEYELAKHYLEEAEKHIPKEDFKNRALYHLRMAEVFENQGRYEDALKHKNEEVRLRRDNYEKEVDSKVAEINTKYEIKNKEKANLELKNQNLIERNKVRQNQNLIFILSGLMLFSFLIALLLQKNTTKKRKLAEQQALLEQQKTETLLKDQELLSIDAMIAGQEKERQRVAHELHDDLGSKMATIKLHVENIKTNKEDPSFKHATKLLEEAYQKIRGISHVKNSGVIAKQGLLPALQGIASTISETNKIQLTVHDFGLENRMENSMELNIFRMIQELVTNIIKHAGATKGSIQLTQHEDSLNILIEDDGKGFDTSKIQILDNGIGLRNIEKRIEHLEGSFTIDSVLGKGTSIIIDIPI